MTIIKSTIDLVIDFKYSSFTILKYLTEISIKSVFNNVIKKGKGYCKQNVGFNNALKCF